VFSGDQSHRRPLGRYFGEGAEKGLQLALLDGLIAATALEHGLIVVSRNTKDFAVLGVGVSIPGTSDRSKTATDSIDFGQPEVRMGM
jgi:hypothetical protein